MSKKEIFRTQVRSRFAFFQSIHSGCRPFFHSPALFSPLKIFTLCVKVCGTTRKTDALKKIIAFAHFNLNSPKIFDFLHIFMKIEFIPFSIKMFHDGLLRLQNVMSYETKLLTTPELERSSPMCCLSCY